MSAQEYYGQHHTEKPAPAYAPGWQSQPQPHGGPAFYSQQPQAQPQMVYIQKPPEKETSSCCLPCACCAACCAGLCCCPCCHQSLPYHPCVSMCIIIITLRMIHSHWSSSLEIRPIM
ncbi:hypothetical protein AB1N83_008156 [Pleurotus pulmonarius]